MKQPSTQIPNFVEVEKAAAPAIKSTLQVGELVDKLTIETDDDIRMATRWIAELKSSRSEIEGTQKSFVEPLKKVVKELNAFFKPALDGLDLMERQIKKAISSNIETRLERRDALLSTVAGTPSKDEKKEIIQQAREAMPEKISGLSIRESWAAEIVDENAIKIWAIANKRMDILAVDKKALDRIAKNAHSEAGIPGWVACKISTVAVTAAKIE